MVVTFSDFGLVICKRDFSLGSTPIGGKCMYILYHMHVCMYKFDMSNELFCMYIETSLKRHSE